MADSASREEARAGAQISVAPARTPTSRTVRAQRRTSASIDTRAPLADFTHVTKPPPKLNVPQVEYTPSRDSNEASYPSRDGDTNLLSEFDASQLEHNLSLTPEERLIEHQHALELVLSLEATGRKLRDEPKWAFSRECGLESLIRTPK